MPTAETEIETLANREYKWGFITDVDADEAPPGLNEETIQVRSLQDIHESSHREHREHRA